MTELKNQTTNSASVLVKNYYSTFLYFAFNFTHSQVKTAD